MTTDEYMATLPYRESTWYDVARAYQAGQEAMRAKAANIAKSCHGAGSHMPHNRAIRDAILEIEVE